MVVIASRKHFRPNNLSMEEFSRSSRIVRGREKSSSQQILENVRRQGFLLNIFMNCDSTEAVKVALARGLGLGVLYRRHVDEEIKAGELKVIKISGLKTHIQSFIIYKGENNFRLRPRNFSNYCDSLSITEKTMSPGRSDRRSLR
jgi:DNA-binding transcriptional LysR family regulator